MMTTHRQEQVQTPKEMVLALRKEMISLKEEETSLKQQIISLNEQFQGLVKSAAERYPEILDEEFSKKAARPLTKLPPNRTEYYRPLRGAAEARSPSHTRSRLEESPHRRPGFDSKRFPRRFGHEWAESRHAPANSQVTTPQEQYEHDNMASGIDPRKIRGSLPNSPTDESIVEQNQETSSEDRRKRLKKRMVEARKVDVVHLGLF